MKKNIVLTILLIFLLFISLETNAQIDKHLTIGISYNQIMAYLDQYISMSKSSDIDGQPRYNGQTSDNLAFLEMVIIKKPDQSGFRSVFRTNLFFCNCI